MPHTHAMHPAHTLLASLHSAERGKVVTAREAVQLIREGDTVATGGFGRLIKLDLDAGRSLVADQLDWRFGPDFAHKTGLHVLFIDGHAAWFNDHARYIQNTGFPWSADDGGPKYEAFWQLFDRLPSGDTELAKLASQAAAK